MAYRKTTGNALFKQERQIDMLSEKNGTDTVIFERRPVAISTSTGDPNLHVFSLAFVSLSYLVSSITWAQETAYQWDGCQKLGIQTRVLLPSPFRKQCYWKVHGQPVCRCWIWKISAKHRWETSHPSRLVRAVSKVKIDNGESNLRFMACGNFPSALQLLRILVTHSVLPFLPLAFTSSVKYTDFMLPSGHALPLPSLSAWEQLLTFLAFWNNFIPFYLLNIFTTSIVTSPTGGRPCWKSLNVI